jgi:hypothetical protein
MRLSLSPLIKIRFGEETGNLLEFSSGVQRDPLGVWIPLPPWRELPELASRMTTNDGADIEYFAVPSSTWRDCIDLKHVERPASTKYVTVLTQMIFNHLRNDPRFRDSMVENYFDPRIGTNPPGCATTTVGPHGRRIGLHLDTWSAEDIDSREASHRRLCVNLGEGDRHFLFVPIALRHLLDNAKSSLRGVEDRFFRDHPDCPIARLTMSPGAGYIAPTDTIIHDGSTTALNTRDIYLATRLKRGLFKQQECYIRGR